MKLKLLALPLASLITQVSADVNAVTEPPQSEKPSQKETLQLNSRALLENSWARVPMSCKDRSFPFDALKVENEIIPARLLHFHEGVLS